jgi:hypothetical protein
VNGNLADELCAAETKQRFPPLFSLPGLVGPHHQKLANACRMGNMTEIKWRGAESLPPKSYTCGFCGKVVGPDRGFREEPMPDNGYFNHLIYICSFCSQPTYFGYGSQKPGAPFGNDVASVPPDVQVLYQEARRCMTVNAFTGAVLLCRKILMNVAVSKGAPEGEQFIKYVEYLDTKGYVPPDGKQWVDHIRKKGNEATHEIKQMWQHDGVNLITFTEMLLRFVYEFPAKVLS